MTSNQNRIAELRQAILRLRRSGALAGRRVIDGLLGPSLGICMSDEASGPVDTPRDAESETRMYPRVLRAWLAARLRDSLRARASSDEVSAIPDVITSLRLLLDRGHGVYLSRRGVGGVYDGLYDLQVRGDGGFHCECSSLDLARGLRALPYLDSGEVVHVNSEGHAYCYRCLGEGCWACTPELVPPKRWPKGGIPVEGDPASDSDIAVLTKLFLYHG